MKKYKSQSQIVEIEVDKFKKNKIFGAVVENNIFVKQNEIQNDLSRVDTEHKDKIDYEEIFNRNQDPEFV